MIVHLVPKSPERTEELGIDTLEDQVLSEVPENIIIGKIK